MKKFLIIGAGAMGSAFTLPCVENSNKVILAGTHLERDNIKKLKSNYYHKSLNAHLSRKVKIIDDKSLDKYLKDSPDYIVIAISSLGIDWACNKLIKNYKKKLSIILLTKGLVKDGDKVITISSKINKIFNKKNLPNQDITSIKGPCLAAGLINKIRTSTVIANKNIKNAKKIQKLISTNYYNTEISKDINGVEAMGAIKNIYAMLVGASFGLSGKFQKFKIRDKYYHNTSSALLSKSLAEMKLFAKKMKGLPQTAYGLAGIGDLHVSVAGGRNSQLGKYLGNGHKFKSIKKNKMQNITTEGSELALEIGPTLKKKFNKRDFPIMFALIDCICKNQVLKIKW